MGAKGMPHSDKTTIGSDMPLLVASCHKQNETVYDTSTRLDSCESEDTADSDPLSDNERSWQASEASLELQLDSSKRR